MTTKVKRQHYIPQSYINRFATNNKIDVYCFDNKILLEQQSAKNFASRKYFYDIPKDEIELYLKEMIEYLKITKRTISEDVLSDEQIVEHHMSKIEGEAQKIFNELEKDQSILKKDEVKAKISNFLHLLAYRTETFRLEDESFYNELYDKAKSIFPNLPEECYSNFFPERAKEDQIKQLLSIRKTLKTGYMLLTRYNWYVGINTSENVNFLISDNPALNVLLGFNDICVPISKTFALIFQIKNKKAPIFVKEKHHKGRMYLTEKSVLWYNAYQVNCAKRYIFGDKKDIELMKKIFSKSDNNVFV